LEKKILKIKSLNAIKKKIIEQGNTAIFVSHDNFDLIEISKKYWFENGKIINFQ
jgi:hypothetical protein